MDKNNVSNNSTSTKNNSSPPKTPPHTPNETNPSDEALETIAKTSEEVLAELNSIGDGINGDGGANEDGAAQGRAPRAMAVGLVAGGSNTAVVEQVGGSDGVRPYKKRKSNLVRDPPAGTPTCPECKKEFASWRAAFGHMRKHPERAHRGFFPPPGFTSPIPAPAPAPPVAGIRAAEDDGQPKTVDEGVIAAVVRELVLDLNRSIAAPAESSGAGGSGRNTEVPAPAPAPENEEARRINVFDLNQLPPNDDEDDEAQEN